MPLRPMADDRNGTVEWPGYACARPWHRLSFSNALFLRRIDAVQVRQHEPECRFSVVHDLTLSRVDVAYLHTPSSMLSAARQLLPEAQDEDLIIAWLTCVQCWRPRRPSMLAQLAFETVLFAFRGAADLRHQPNASRSRNAHGRGITRATCRAGARSRSRWARHMTLLQKSPRPLAFANGRNLQL